MLCRTISLFYAKNIFNTFLLLHYGRMMHHNVLIKMRVLEHWLLGIREQVCVGKVEEGSTMPLDRAIWSYEHIPAWQPRVPHRFWQSADGCAVLGCFRDSGMWHLTGSSRSFVDTCVSWSWAFPVSFALFLAYQEVKNNFYDKLWPLRWPKCIEPSNCRLNPLKQ